MNHPNLAKGIILVALLALLGWLTWRNGQPTGPTLAELATAFPSDSPSTPSTPGRPAAPMSDPPLSYRVFKRTDVSIGRLSKEGGNARTRYALRILADGSFSASQNQRAQVVMTAAREFLLSNDADTVEVVLHLSEIAAGSVPAIAIAYYAPDGKGLSGYDHYTWEVRAAKEPVEEMHVKVADIWFSTWNDGRFRRSNGTTDEPKMIAYIAKMLGIKRGDVHLPGALPAEYFRQ